MIMTMVTLCPVRHAVLRTMWTNVVGALVVLGSVAYLAGSLHDGWVPHDTGQLGQTAERVLDGEMQHRDFDEPYTVGWAACTPWPFSCLACARNPSAGCC